MARQLFCGLCFGPVVLNEGGQYEHVDIGSRWTPHDVENPVEMGSDGDTSTDGPPSTEMQDDCDDEVHAAYENLQRAIQRYAQSRDTDACLVTDWVMISALVYPERGIAGYCNTRSSSALHNISGLLSVGQNMIDGQIQEMLFGDEEG